MYYDNQNIQCWLRACLEERYESYCAEEKQIFNDDVLLNIQSLKEECAEIIKECLEFRDHPLLFTAIMNSVDDWAELYDDVKNDVEAEK
jgi:hypothetical protein